MTIFQLKKYLIRLPFIHSFVPEIIYEGSSNFNKDIKVIKIGRNKKLIVNGLVQSFNKSSGFAKKRVWGKVVDTIHIKAPKTEKVLLLGMGAGTMVHMLNEKFKGTRLKITSVEIDQQIVDIAYKYFDLSSADNNRVIVVDAYKVIKNPSRYDINSNQDCVIVDTYLGDSYPSNISDRKFLKYLFNMVDIGTFVIFNHVIKRSEISKLAECKKELELFIEPVYIKKINCHGTSDNYLFYGVKKG